MEALERLWALALAFQTEIGTRPLVRGPGPAWTLAQLAIGTAALTAVYLVVFAVGVARLPPTERRRRSWLLTTVSSTGTSLAGLYFGYRLVTEGLRVLYQEDPLTTDYGLSVFAIIFFAVYLVLDIALGVVFYREQMGFLTGWVHHSLYLVMLWWVSNEKLQPLFTAFLLSEIPTMLMSFGHLDKRYRTDALFGLSYLFVRVLYHGYLLVLFLENWTPGWSLVIGTLVMHLHWFRQWVSSQLRKGILEGLGDWLRPQRQGSGDGTKDQARASKPASKTE